MNNNGCFREKIIRDGLSDYGTLIFRYKIIDYIAYGLVSCLGVVTLMSFIGMV